MKGAITREKIFNAYSSNLIKIVDYYLELGVDNGNGTRPIDRPVYICVIARYFYNIFKRIN